MEPVDILVRIDEPQHGCLVKVIRQRQLHQNAVYARVLIQRADSVLKLRLRAVFRQAQHGRANAGLLAGVFLVADVDLTRGVLADEHDSQMRHHAVLCEGKGLLRRRLLEAGGDRAPIHDNCSHIFPLFSPFASFGRRGRPAVPHRRHCPRKAPAGQSTAYTADRAFSPA